MNSSIQESNYRISESFSVPIKSKKLSRALDLNHENILLKKKESVLKRAPSKSNEAYEENRTAGSLDCSNSHRRNGNHKSSVFATTTFSRHAIKGGFYPENSSLLLESIESCVLCNDKTFFCDACYAATKDYFSKFSPFELNKTYGKNLPSPDSIQYDRYLGLLNEMTQLTLGVCQKQRENVSEHLELRLLEFKKSETEPCHDLTHDTECLLNTLQ